MNLNNKVYMNDWMSFNPYIKPCKNDFHYLRICQEVNRYLNNSQNTILVYYLSVDNKKKLSCFLTAYFVDIISESNIWNTFITKHKQLYNRYLPFYHTNKDYIPNEINPQDIQFLIWYFISQTLKDIEEFVHCVRLLEPSFGAFNLQDIKGPECFEIEQELIKRCKIPVFHDDQHGTAIVTAAGMLNALEIQGKNIESAKIVCMGAGAAAVACMELLIKCGAQRERIYMLDRKGVIHTRREDLTEHKKLFANNTDKRTLEDVMEGADIFVGVSGPDVLPPEALSLMAENPIVFACSNPDPEIKPELAHEVRKDLIMATGRSDYPNQVNNVLCFPFIFRGALDVRATAINDEMKVAAVEALRSITKEPVPEEVLAASKSDSLTFGKEYIIPKPMDPRLCERIATAVSKAAIESGVARVPESPEE